MRINYRSVVICQQFLVALSHPDSKVFPFVFSSVWFCRQINAKPSHDRNEYKEKKRWRRRKGNPLTNWTESKTRKYSTFSQQQQNYIQTEIYVIITGGECMAPNTNHIYFIWIYSQRGLYNISRLGGQYKPPDICRMDESSPEQ